MKKRFKKYLSGNEQLMQVIWTDSWCPEHGWCDLMDIESTEYFIHSVGILVDENKSTITLASSQGISNPAKIINPLMIPKCCIKKIQKL